MIEKTEAIVLRSVKFQESSLIATIFCRKHGRISVIARGARKPKSRFSAMLTPGQLLEVVFHHKDTRSVQTLTEADYLKAHNSFRTNVQKMAAVTTLCELLLQILHENDPNEALFDFLKTMTGWIDQQPVLTPTLFPYLQIRIADKIGFGLQAEDEGAVHAPATESTPSDHQTSGLNPGFKPTIGYLNITSGAISQSPEDLMPVRLTGSQYQFSIRAVTSGDSSIFSIPLTKAECSQLIQYIDQYYAYHIDGIRLRKSDAIFEQLFDL